MAYVQFLISIAGLAYKVYSEQKLINMLRSIMEELGDQEFKNALSALESGKNSPLYERDWTFNAINHLETAASNFEDRRSKMGERQGWFENEDGLHRSICPNCFPEDYKMRVSLEEKQVLCYAMIARALNDLGDRQNAVKYAIIFRDVTVKYLKFEDTAIQGTIYSVAQAEAKYKWCKCGQCRSRLESNRIKEAFTKELLAIRKKSAITVLKELSIAMLGLDQIPDYSVCQDCLKEARQYYR